MAADYEADNEVYHWFYAGSIALAAYAMFRGQNKLVELYGIPASVKECDWYQWRNIFVSLTHSWIAGVWVIVSCVLYPEMMEDPVAFFNPCIYALLAFSTGYFAADMVDIVSNKRALQTWEIILHHFVVLYMMIYNLAVCRYLGATAFLLTVEVNSVFLHTRKMLQMFGVSFQSLPYRITVLLNIVTFLICRFGSILWVTYAIYTHIHRMTTVYFIALGSMMLVTWVLNFGLLHRIVKSDFLRKSKAKSGKSEGNGIESNGRHVSNNNLRKRMVNGSG